MSKMTPSLENYLETIYEFTKKKGEARVTEIAMEIGISKPSVNQALITLSEMGLVNYKKYSPLTLTEAGIKKAAAIHKRHHVFEEFLTNVLKVPKDIAEIDACKMEHVISETTFNKFTEFLTSFKDKQT